MQTHFLPFALSLALGRRRGPDATVPESTFFLPNFGGSSGNLCIGAPQYRFIHDILNSGGSGAMAYSVDFQDLPQNQTFTAGSRWHFQLWYRNVGTSNTTEGITFVWE